MPQGYGKTDPYPATCAAGDCFNVWTVKATGGKIAGRWCSPRCFYRVRARLTRSKRFGTRLTCEDCGCDMGEFKGTCPQRRCLDCGGGPYRPRPKRRFVCGVCSVTFESHQHGSMYCSRKCKRRSASAQANQAMHRRRRRAVKLGAESEPYSVQEIGERDGWKCHICGRRTLRPRASLAWHKDKPTIDHLVPISLGGPDIRSNVALAHALCNSTKGAKAADDQLLLF